MTRKTIRSWLTALLFAFCTAGFLFVGFPGIDLAVSSWFFHPTQGFWLDTEWSLAAYRRIFNVMSVSLALASLVFWAWSFWRRPVFGIGYRVWAFITMLYVLGPVVLVNGVLKSFFGRARPADVQEFGGEATFTPAMMISDQCVGNCSFVSGEGSSAAAFFISILVLSSFVADRTKRIWMVVGAFGIAFVAAFLRIIKGRHFMSDTIFSVLLVTFVAALLYWILLRRHQRG